MQPNVPFLRLAGKAASVTALIAAVSASGGGAQDVLTISQALSRADRRAFPNRIAVAVSRQASARAIEPLAGVLPDLRLAGGWARTTDPLSAFGYRLEQRALTAASFDPTRLNYPSAATNIGAGIILEQPLLNPDALLGRRAAERGLAAERASERWTRVTTGLDVVRAYYGAVLATARATSLATASKAAQEHVRQAEALHLNGAVTRSDGLLASVRAREVGDELLAATGAVREARLALSVVLGSPGDTDYALPVALPPGERLRALAARVASDTGAHQREDVHAAELGRASAEAGLDRARSRLLPRVNAFGRLDWNAPTTVFGGRDGWTVGIAVSWSPFGGAADWSGIGTALGARASATARADAASAEAWLDRERAGIELTVATERLLSAERAVEEAQEAHRIVSRKYDGGLAAVVELMDAAAAEDRSRLSFDGARYELLVAIARRRQAAGLDYSVMEELGQ